MLAVLVVSLVPVVSGAGTGGDRGRAPASSTAVGTTRAAVVADDTVAARARAAYGRLPISFVPNAGQVDPRVRFSARAGDSTVFLTGTGAVLAPAGATQRPLSLTLAGAADDAPTVGERPLPGRVNYLRGNDPSGWRTDLPTFARVTTKQAYPGIDVTWYGKGTQLEYDFTVAPGADPGRIAITVDGARALRLDGGDLVAETEVAETAVADTAAATAASTSNSTSTGEVRQKAPVVYQDVDGRRRHVPGRFVLRDDRTVGFDLGVYDRSRPLVIDPVISYSSYLGGNKDDAGYGIAVDAAGAAYITGGTCSPDFPTAPDPDSNAFGPLKPECTLPIAGDVFVTKVSPTGSLVYSTYFGGISTEAGFAIAVDSGGSAYVTGTTDSPDFPMSVPPGYSTVCRCSQFGLSSDAFVLALDPAGSSVRYSTFVGGAIADHGGGIALREVDGAGNPISPPEVFVTGSTSSPDFPTTLGAFDPTAGGGVDAFVAKLRPAGAGLTDLAYSTYLGGVSDEIFDHFLSPGDIAVDPAGDAYVTGDTTSLDFPSTLGAFQPSLHGVRNGYVAQVRPAGLGVADLIYATFLGGEEAAPGFEPAYGGDLAKSIALGPVVGGVRTVAVGGEAASMDFPTTPGAFQSDPPGCSTRCDGFVARLLLDPADNEPGADDTSDLLYSSFVGSTGGGDLVLDTAVALNGDLVLLGITNSSVFPVKKPVQSGCGCFYLSSNFDLFVMKLTPNADDTDPGPSDPSDLRFSTYLGGTGEELAGAMAVDGDGSAYVTGQTDSPETATLSDGTTVSIDYPTTKNAFQPNPGGELFDKDALVTKVALGKPRITVADASVVEADTTKTAMFFTVSLSAESAGDVTVRFATANGTAKAAKDYVAKSGTVTIPAGATTATFKVGVLGDTLVEADETFVVNLSSPVGASIADAQAVGTIEDND